jgi:tripartite ATP-independent transporter DctM subunit
MLDLLLLLAITLGVALVIGVPIGYAMFIAGFVGLIDSLGFEATTAMLVSVVHTQTASYVFSTIPMFILLAEFLDKSDLLDDVFTAMYRWTSWIPGGLAITTTFANGGFAALSGSSTAAAAALSKIAVPEMREYDYDDRLSMGTVAASGTFAMMFPPSIGLIVYGILTENSIGTLFIAGMTPGILTMIAYVLLIIGWVTYSPGIVGATPRDFTWGERFRSLTPIWPAALLIFVVLGSIYLGVVTPTESGALGAFGAFLIGRFVYDLSSGDMKVALSGTAQTTTMIFVIILGALLFGRYLAITGATQALIQTVSELPVGRYGILLVLLGIYLVLGMVMNQTAILVLTLPVTYPLAVDGLGFHPIWFGIVIIKTAEIGMITPPFGLNVYVASSPIDVDIKQAFAGASRFIIADVAILILLILFPAIATWLPGA